MRLRAAAALVFLVAALTASPAPAGVSREKPGRPPAGLWKQFPLGQKLAKPPAASLPETTPRPTPAPAPEPTPAPPLEQPSHAGARPKSSFPIFAVAAAAAGVVLLLLVAVVARRRRRPAARVRDGPAAASSSVEDELARLAAISAELEVRRESRERPVPTKVNVYGTARASRGGRDPMARLKKDAKAESQVMEETVVAEDEPRPTRSTYTEIGDRVASVLQSAEEVAERIREDAREQAEEIRRAAEGAATLRTGELEREAEAVRKQAEEQAEGIRRTGEIYATQIRRESEEETRKLLAEAEAQARAIREAAEEMSRQIDLNAQKRRAELENHLETLESRLERFLTGLRGMTTEIEKLLRENADEQGGISLVDALDVRPGA